MKKEVWFVVNGFPYKDYVSIKEIGPIHPYLNKFFKKAMQDTYLPFAYPNEQKIGSFALNYSVHSFCADLKDAK